jgi:hypothetical protein
VFSFSRSVAIGKPARTALIKVAQQADGVAVSCEHVKALLPLRNAQRADVQIVALHDGAVIAIARITGEDGREAAAVLGRTSKGLQVVWSGATGPRGDPGERHANVIEIQEQAGGQTLLLAQTDERARICGQPRTLLRPRTVDPQTLALKPVAFVAAPAPGGAGVVEIEAREAAPTLPPVPLLPALREVAVSSRAGAEETEVRSGRLTDGDLGSFWSEGGGANGNGEFATFQWLGAGRPMSAIAFVPVPSAGAAQAAMSIARSLWLVGDDGARLHVKLPAAPKPGARYSVQLDQPLNWRCMSVVLDDTAALPGSKPGPAVLAEVQVFTDLDFGTGLPGLVAELTSGGTKAGQAAQLLATLGTPAVAALQQAWPKLDAAGRLRATHVFGLNCEADAGARQMLSTALDDPSEEVAKAASSALLAAGPRSRAVLLPRLTHAGRSSDDLAIALARRQPTESVDALLVALAAKGGPDREAIRRAIALACQHGGQPVLERVKAWSQSDAVGVSARAALALALARAQSGQDARPLAQEIAAAAAPQATDFADLWRLVQAARALPGGEPLDAWLAKIAGSDQRWMLRAAALTALTERSAAHLQDTARAALKDEYPRVRVAAIDAIGSKADAVELLSMHATRDTWPMVRVAAVDALAGVPGTAPVLRTTLNDSARLVRAAGIRALARMKQRDAWPLVKAHLEDPDEWREVLIEATAFAGALCMPDARNALVGFLRQGVEPEANTRATELGVAALDALRRIGGEAEKAALALAHSAGAPVAFRAAAEQPLPPGAACQPPAAR